MAAFVTAIVTAVQAAATWYSTAGIFVKAAFNIGASFLVSRLVNKSANKGRSVQQGGRVQLPPQTNNSIPIVYGSAYVNGIITDARLVSTNNKTNNVMYYCIVLSETANTNATYTINNIYWNDVKLVFETSTGNRHKVLKGVKSVDSTDDYEDTNFRDGSTNFVQIRVYAGGTTSTRQIFPQTDTAENAYSFWPDNLWTSQHQMEGLVFAIVRLEYSQEKGFTGLPNITFNLSNSVSNPADVWYDYMTSKRYGAGIDAADIDTASLNTWRTHCNEYWTGTTWQTTPYLQTLPRYSINGIIDTGNPVKANIDQILQNSSAWMSYDITQGLWRVYPQAPQAASLTFTEDYIVGGIEISSTSLEDLYNSVEVEYCDRNNFDQRLFARDLVPAYQSGYTGIQRNPNEPDNELKMTLDLVNNNVQALRIGRIQLKQTRDDLVIKFMTTHYGLQAQAGDVINVKVGLYSWNTGTFQDGKPFRITRIKEVETEEGALLTEITALEYNELVYAETTTSEFVPSGNIGIKPADSLPRISVSIPLNGQDPAASVPNFDILYSYSGSEKYLADEIRLYAIEAASNSTPDPSQYQYVGSIRPNPGSDFSGLLSYTQNVTGITATAAGNSYFVRARLARSGRVGPLSDAATIVWAPQVITAAVAGTSSVFSPTTLTLATDSQGAYGGTSQTVKQYLLVGTQRLNLYNGPPSTLPNDNWTVDNVTSVGATGLTTVKNDALDQVEFTITGLTNAASGYTADAYIESTLYYRDSSGVLNDLGQRRVQVIQQRSGAQGVSGIQGVQGTFGLQGITGNQGIQGVIGNQGVQGLTGNQGIQGITGPIGPRNAIVYAYKRSSTALPSTDDPGTVTFDFTTFTITTPLGNGWSSTIPSGTDPLYVVAASASGFDLTDTITSVEWSEPVLLVRNGLDGISASTVFLYRRSTTSTPPSINRTGNSTYVFSTGTITGQPVGWQLSIPNKVTADEVYIWAISATAIASDTTSYSDQIANTDWTDAILVVEPGAQGIRGGQGIQGTFGLQGIQGTVGGRTALVYAYKRSTALPTDTPGQVTYNFDTNTITNVSLANGWSKTIPEGADSLYVTIATATGSLTTDTIESNEWAQPVLFVYNGVNAATVFLYARNNSTTLAPNLDRTGSSTYNFRTGVVNPRPTGWNVSIPSASEGTSVWVIQATASNAAETDTIPNTEWSTPVLTTAPGTQGIQGTGGGQGIQGLPGQQGTQGIQAAQGTQGIPGQQGIQGTLGPEGTKYSIVYAYKRSNVQPNDTPGSVIYNFTSRTITSTLANGWSTSIPAGTNTAYVITATAFASGSSTTDTIEANEWGGVSVLAQNGQDGLNGFNSATIFLYARNDSSTAPTFRTGSSSSYDFNTGILTNAPSGWTQYIPTTGGVNLWVRTSTASSRTTTDTILDSEFNDAALVGTQGLQGTGGQTGLQGSTGLQGGTGVQGNTGIGVQGAQGTTGVRGPDPYYIEVVPFDSTYPSSFTYSPPTLSFPAVGVMTPSFTVYKVLTFGISNITSITWTRNTGTNGNYQTFAANTTTTPANQNWKIEPYNAPGGIAYSGLDFTVSVVGQDSLGTSITVTKSVNIPILTNGGVVSASVSVFQWASGGVSPGGSSTYTYSTGQLSPVPNGWSYGAPQGIGSQGQYLWEANIIITDRYTGPTQTRTIQWSTVTPRPVSYYANDGVQGTRGNTGLQGATGTQGTTGQQGQTGQQGPTGDAGAGTWYWDVGSVNNSSAPDLTEFQGLAQRSPRDGDIVIKIYNNKLFSIIYERIGTTWQSKSQYFTGDMIASGTIKAAQLAIGSVIGEKIAGTTISGDKLITGTIQGIHIAAQTITGTNIAGGTITGEKIVGGSIQGTSIQGNTITADKILSTAILSNQLKVGTAERTTTTMTGSGANIYTDGKFVLGSSATNITYDGTSMYLNGNVVGTGNINLNAVSNVSVFTNPGFRNLTFFNDQASFGYLWPNNTRCLAFPTTPSIIPTTGSKLLINWSVQYYSPSFRNNLIEVWRAFFKNSVWTKTRLYYAGSGVDPNSTAQNPPYYIQGEEIASGSLIDTSFDPGNNNYYIFVVGSLSGEQVSIGNPFLSITELKR